MFENKKISGNRELLILQSLKNKFDTLLAKSSLERVNSDTKNNHFALNNNGHVIGLRLSRFNDKNNPLCQITEELCSLTSLEYLYLENQDISIIPIKIKKLTKLVILNLWANPISEIPHELVELKNLKYLFLSGENSIIPYKNVLPLLKLMKHKGNIEIGKLWRVIQEDKDKKQEIREICRRFAKKKVEKFKRKKGGRIEYPPNLVELKGNNQFEYIILLLLKINPIITWEDLVSEPLSFPVSTVSKYLRKLSINEFICTLEKGHYMISKNGRKRLKELSSF